MSWTLPPNGDIGRVDIDWLTNELDRQRHYAHLISFLCKLDSRFGFPDPWAELKLAQRYFSKP